MGAITFYYYPLSPPSKVVWSVLEALKIPYEMKHIDLVETRENREPEYLAINPEGQVPYIEDGDFGMAESRAIICYLCSKYEEDNKENKLYPRDIEGKAKVDIALFQDIQHWAYLLQYTNIPGVLLGGETGPIESKWRYLEMSYKGMERRLKNHRYLAGDHITVADYSALGTTGGIEYLLHEINEESYPRLFEWKRKMESLPFYQKCYGDSMKILGATYKQLVAANRKE